MNRKEIEQYLIDFQKKEFPALIDRSLKIYKTKKISAIIGPRRAGKTSFLYQLMKELIAEGGRKDEIIYLNFENTKLFDLKFKEIKEAVDLHKKLFPEAKKITLFLDEPQNIINWETAVRELHDDNYSIYISGSSSKVLSKEIATSLRGRSLTYLLLPFSFKEILRFKKIEPSKLISSDEKIKIMRLLDEYFEFGGFPEVVLETNKDLKLKILESYFDLVIYRDIAERHGLKDSILIKWFIKSIASSYTKEVSINKLYLTLKSQGRIISKDELYTYAALINDSLFSLYLPKYSVSIRKREPVNKAYLCDTGFSKIIEVTKDSGKKMENIVFLELTRTLSSLSELHFWKNVQQEEVDFVVKEGTKITKLIQVCYDIQETKTKEREIRALLKASRELKCKNLIVITNDHEAEEYAEWFGMKGRIKYIPLWKFLLTREN